MNGPTGGDAKMLKGSIGLIVVAACLMGSDAPSKLSQYAIVNQQIAHANAVIARHHAELYVRACCKFGRAWGDHKGRRLVT